MPISHRPLLERFLELAIANTMAAVGAEQVQEESEKEKESCLDLKNFVA